MDDGAQTPTQRARVPGGDFDVLRTQGDDARDSFRPKLPVLPARRTWLQQITALESFRPASFSTSEPEKGLGRVSSSGAGRTDPLARIRRAALDVLIVPARTQGEARVFRC
jgi:hypothetical protein